MNTGLSATMEANRPSSVFFSGDNNTIHKGEVSMLCPPMGGKGVGLCERGGGKDGLTECTLQ